MSLVKPLETTPEEWSAAQRIADAVNLHVAAVRAQLGNGRTAPGYVAVRLSDGRSDGVLYDSRADATRHQPDPWSFYVKVGPDSMGTREALVLLMAGRQAKKTGTVFTEEEVLVPQRLELVQPYIPRTFRAVQSTFKRGRGQ